MTNAVYAPKKIDNPPIYADNSRTKPLNDSILISDLSIHPHRMSLKVGIVTLR